MLTINKHGSAVIIGNGEHNMMISKRLIGSVSESKKYIVGNVALQWCSLVTNIIMIGTICRAACVFFMKKTFGLGAVIPAAVGFWFGILFLLFLDRITPHLHANSEYAEGIQTGFSRTTMMLLAVTLHNIPEGMAVGVVYAGFLTGNGQITAAGALALSLGIAIQNFPE